MKAILISKYKEALHIADVAEPTRGDHDVIVQVKSVGLNLVDELIRSGAFRLVLRYRLPQIVGSELAGVVVGVGSQVRGFKVGDAVYARQDVTRGTFAERIAVPEHDLALAPSSIGLEEAGSLPLVALTAWQALVERGAVKPGQKVLIHGGAGGLGSIAIQFAKHLGATVATTASAANADFVRGLGADVAVDYRSEAFEKVLSDYDLVLDSVGGGNVLKSVEVLKPGGKLIDVNGVGDPAAAKEQGFNPLLRIVVAALTRRVRARAKKLGVTYEYLFMHPDGRQLAEITALVDAGIIRPVVGKAVTFDEIPEAVEALRAGGVRGKVIATFGS